MADAKTTKKTTATAKAAAKPAAPKKTLAVKEGPVKGTRTGVVESDKRSETRTVVVNYMSKHPKYGKIIRTTKKVKAHDEDGVAGVGDRVSLMETRPLSATKRWRLVDILEKAK